MFAAVLAAIVAIALGVVSNELFAWLPRLADVLLRRGAKRFRDPALAERFLEEWRSAIAEIPGGFAAVCHAATLFACVKSVERSYSAAMSASDVEETFADLGTTVRQFTDTFAAALTRHGLTLEDVARVTKLSLRDLTALAKGDFSRIAIGYQSIFAFMPDLATLIDSDLREVKARYADLLRKSGGLPPAPAASFAQSLSRIWCLILGHRATKHFVHSQTPFSFHWSYRRCDRCGDVSVMRAEPCGGRKVRIKLDIDVPVRETFSCETQGLYTSSTLEEPDRFRGLDDRIDLTLDRRKALSEQAGRD